MLQHIKTLLKDKIIFIAIAITVFILYLSLYKLPDFDIKVNNIDKVYHLIAYYTLGITWLFAFYKLPKYKTVIIISCILFGIIIELLQYLLTNYRTADYIDAIANSLGVLLALITFNLIFRKKQIK